MCNFSPDGFGMFMIIINMITVGLDMCFNCYRVHVCRRKSDCEKVVDFRENDIYDVCTGQNAGALLRQLTNCANVPTSDA